MWVTSRLTILLNLYLETQFPAECNLPPVKADKYLKIEHVALKLGVPKAQIYNTIRDSKTHHGFYSKGVFYIHPDTFFALFKEHGVRTMKQEIRLNKKLAKDYGVDVDD